ncbi:MAG: hypothetical protein ACI4EA_02740 [Candidatus Ornithomonoglobus sp.]
MAGILDEKRQELTDNEIGAQEYFSSVKELLRDARSRETKNIILAEIAVIKRAIEDEETAELLL